MRDPNPSRFLDIRFSYYDDDDDKLLDEGLHRELSRLQPHILGFCESLYGWEILDTDERLETETRLYSSIWIPLEGLASRFRRRNQPELFRYFELEVSVVTEDTVSFTVFENMTEFSNFAPFGYQQVAEADVEAHKLGIRARGRYRPATESVEESGT
jgi:hypothetical protein